MQRFFTLFFSFILLIVILLWLSSYTHHTSLGIDHDFEQKDKILHTYYRISWTGSGSVWIGYGSNWKQPEEIKSLEKLDLASTFFQRTNRQVDYSSMWNKIGFWYIHAIIPKPTFWIGVPSWLPVLLLGLLVFVRQCRVR